MGTHTCPRRAENGMDDPASPFRGAGSGLDDWRPGRAMGGAKQPPEFRSCSYCGSMHPDDFMQVAHDGVKIGPTDKSYKAYVGDYGKFYFQHLSAEQQELFIDLLNMKKVHVGYPGRFYVLPFFARTLPPAPS